MLLVMNPAAREAARLYEGAMAAFRSAGADCDAFVTEQPGHAASTILAASDGYDAVFTLGGDGTAMEVVGALAGSGLPVGVLAGGTGNLIARSLGVPRHVRFAVPALLAGTVARVDLGRLSTGRRFAFATGVGIDAAMIERTPGWLKRRIGVWAYALAAVRAILRGDRFHVRATVDGGVHERVASAVMIANFGAVLDDLITLGPEIRQDDGRLDLCVFSPHTLRDALRVVWRLAHKDFRPDPCMLFVSGTSFRVETTPPRAAQADGELIGDTPFEAWVEPHAATLLLPRPD